MDKSFCTVDEAIQDLRQGKMIVLVDDECRENEGDLVCAAEMVTPEIVNFMATHGRGMRCMPLTGKRCDELHLHFQTTNNTSPLGTAFTVTIDARQNITTGISAADRAETIRQAVSDDCRPEDLVRYAVWGMLPKNRLGRKLYKKLKVYAGPNHPHEAQQPQPLELPY